MASLHPRQSDIVELARQRGRVDVEGLADHFDVSPQTIRKDLNELCGEKILQRIHGGAVYPSTVSNIAYLARRSMAGDGKRAIAEKVARLIPDNSSVMLNIGTTTEQVAMAIKRHKGLLVITNNLNVAADLSDARDIELVVAGGIVRKADRGIVGEMARDTMQKYKVDFGVIGISAIDEDGSLLDFDTREVEVTRAILSHARTAVLVADSQKFSRRAPALVGSLNDIDVLVTDKTPSPDMQALCQRYQVKLEVAPQLKINRRARA